MKKLPNFSRILPWLLIISGFLLLISRNLIKSLLDKIIPNQEATVDQEAEYIEEEPDDQDENPKTRDERIVQHFHLIRDVLPDSLSNNFAMIVTAHAMHETGVFTSRLYKEQNNMFGMRHPTLRDTKSTGMNAGHATFNNLADSVRDLELYFDHFKFDTSVDNPKAYTQELARNKYFTGNYVLYQNAMVSHYNKVRTLIQ